MAFQSITGQGLWLPSPPPYMTSFNVMSSTIDATGEKFSWLGRVWTPTRGTKSVRKVHFMFGTVTKAGGSALTVSLQNISTAAGNPPQPDETQDQTVAIANADAGFVSSTWYTTGNLSADRSVTFGEELAVVVEYDGGGRLGADTVSFNNITRNAFGGSQNLPACSLKTASWAAVTALPNILLEFSDGTFGTLYGSFPHTTTAQVAFKQNTGTADEYALDITPNFACKVDGLWAWVGAAATTADFDFVLYAGTSAMTGGTVSHDGMWTNATSEPRLIEAPFTQEIELAAGTTYRLSVKPTQTTSNVALRYFDVAAAGHMDVHSMGSSALLNSRLDLGAWIGTVSTRRPFMGLRISALDDGAGGGGGVMTLGGMTGGNQRT